MKSARHLKCICKVSMYWNRGRILKEGEKVKGYQVKPAHTQGFIDVILLFKSVYRGRGGETLAKFMCIYFMDGLLHTLSHITLRSILTSHCLKPCKLSLIIFYYQKLVHLKYCACDLFCFMQNSWVRWQWIWLEKIELDIK